MSLEIIDTHNRDRRSCGFSAKHKSQSPQSSEVSDRGGFYCSRSSRRKPAQAETVNKTLSYGDRGSVIATLQSTFDDIAVHGIFSSQTLSKLKSYQTPHGLEVNATATPETLTRLGLHNLAPGSQQYGKLKLVNNLSHEVMIFIYQPGEEKYSRYAYLPPCSQRTLQSNYSNLSQVSLNLQKKGSIGNLQGDHFEFKTSSFSEDRYSVCPGQLQVAGRKPTVDLVVNFPGLKKPPKYQAFLQTSPLIQIGERIIRW